MKYLVNRETKEHFAYRGIVPSENWDVVEADAEGWIKWDGGECPLPEGALVSVQDRDGQIWDPVRAVLDHAAEDEWWQNLGSVADIIAYRPILDMPDKEFLEACNNSAGAQFAEGWNADIDRVLERAIEESAAEEVRLPTLLERLKAAHEAAQRIPEMEAELREVLGAMGYDLVARSPFVGLSEQYPLDPEFAKAIEENIFNLAKSEPDMSDWRNWKPGDLVERVRDPVEQCAKLGGVYRLTRVDTTEAGTERAWYIGEDGAEVWSSPNNFRFHSRPEVRS